MNQTNEKVRFLSPGHEQRVDLAVIIVSWNVKDLLINNLTHLLESVGSISAEVIVVDNASTDGSVEAIRSTFPSVHVIANPDNRGFSTANEQGRAVARARHILLLNPDMLVEAVALQKTVEYLDAHPDVGVVGACLKNEDGTTVYSVRRFPDFWTQLAILLKLPHLSSRPLKRYLRKDFDYTREQPAEVVRGSYFAINGRALEKVGGLDTNFFVWFEEVDYCKRLRTSGFQVMYVPTIHATDLLSQSFKQVHLFKSQARLTQSLIRYFKKWHPRWQSLVFEILRPPLLVASWIVEKGMKMVGIKKYRRIET